MKISKWIYAAVLGVLFASCQSVETPMFSDKNDAFVAFDEKEFIFPEDSVGELRIPVSLGASKGYDIAVKFTIDASAYDEAGTAALEGMRYRLKNETNTLLFSENDKVLTQYIVIETINNDVFDGDAFFDITIEFDEVTRCKCHENGIHISMGAYSTTKITIEDDDHPLRKAGILGSYKGSGPSLFEGEESVKHSWDCVINNDETDVFGVWINSLAPAINSSIKYDPVYGQVSEDMNSITIRSGQLLVDSVKASDTDMWNFVLEFGSASEAIATRSNGKDFVINSAVVVAVYDTKTGNYLGAYYAVGPVDLTKVGE